MQPNKLSTSQPHHTSSLYYPANINSPPYNPGTPPPHPTNPAPQVTEQTPVAWNERAVCIMIKNKELDGFAAILQDIKHIAEAQEHAQKIVELLGKSLQWTSSL